MKANDERKYNIISKELIQLRGKLRDPEQLHKWLNKSTNSNLKKYSCGVSHKGWYISDLEQVKRVLKEQGFTEVGKLKKKQYWLYIENFWPDPENMFNILKKELPFKQGQVMVYGSIHDERRLTCFYGTKGYTYSGRNIPKKLPPKNSAIQEILDIINDEEFKKGLFKNFPLLKDCYPTFNAVLCNLYRGKKTRDAEGLKKCDNIGPHADDEKALKSSVILSLSFGATRKFRFRKFNNSSGWCFEQKLAPGSALIMLPGCQQKFKHFVPEEKRVEEDRINLTFRYV